MTEYTPSTEQVRQLYANSMDPEGFDRWLAQVKADAWDGGYRAAHYDAVMLIEADDATPNPYRKETA